MPSHLHPRSRLTTSLFGTTLAVSFLIVSIPHLLPCPSPRTALSETETTPDGRRIRRRRSRAETTAEDMDANGNNTIDLKEEAMARVIGESRGRECPVPKPGGVIGRFFGFQGEQQGRQQQEQLQDREQ
jgi:cytochrome c oxidase assembly factor 2